MVDLSTYFSALLPESLLRPFCVFCRRIGPKTRNTGGKNENKRGQKQEQDFEARNGGRWERFSRLLISFLFLFFFFPLPRPPSLRRVFEWDKVEKRSIDFKVQGGPDQKQGNTRFFFSLSPFWGDSAVCCPRRTKRQEMGQTPEQGTFPPPIGAGSPSVSPCENPRRGGVFSVLIVLLFLVSWQSYFALCSFFSRCYHQMQQEIGFNLLRFFYS